MTLPDPPGLDEITCFEVAPWYLVIECPPVCPVTGLAVELHVWSVGGRLEGYWLDDAGRLLRRADVGLC